MLIRSFVSLLLLCLSSSLLGQSYSGTAFLRLASVGNAASTELSTEQLVVEYQPGAQQLTLLLKTAALGLGATPEAQTILREVWQAPANPLLQLQANLAEARPFGNDKAIRVVPLTLTYNGQQATVEAQLTLQDHGNTVSISLETELSLAALGLALPARFADRYADEVILTLPQSSLSRR
jgi:hypothetical protein